MSTIVETLRRLNTRSACVAVRIHRKYPEQIKTASEAAADALEDMLKPKKYNKKAN